MTRDLHRAAERFDAVYQAGQSGTFTDIGSPDSVVLNGKTEVGIVGFDAHCDLGRLCVLGDVGEGFGNNVLRGHFGGLGQALVDTEVELDRHRGAPGQLLECWPESSFGQNRRVNPV